MPWTPPAGVIPTDRKSPSVPTLADIPAMLDWLRDYYPGNTVIGVLATARAERMTYRVDGEPGYGTPGTLSNYVLTKLDWDRDVIDAALADIPDQVAAGLAPVDAALEQVADSIAATAQAQALLEAAAGTKTVATQAALAGQPAGAYILIASNERVSWNGNAVTARNSLGNPLIGTRTQRRATTPTGPVAWIETDGITVWYRPGVGWRDAYGGDPDAPPPPEDTGEL